MTAASTSAESSGNTKAGAAGDITEPLPNDVTIMLEEEERSDEFSFTPDPAIYAEGGDFSFVPAPDFANGSYSTRNLDAARIDQDSTAAAGGKWWKAGRGDGWIEGDGTHECPEAYPIKGNASSHIYHIPGVASYSATIPDVCFNSEDLAVARGFRAPRRGRSSR